MKTNKFNVMNIYDFIVTDNSGNEVSMSKYKGKVLLIVNTATGCGFTPQYEGLERLYKEYKDKGLEILDFPCNQFGHQAPGTDREINSFCQLKYDTTFPRFKKINVNGKDASPLFSWLKKQKGGIFGSSIKWNFTKFLVDKEGRVIKRYSPTTPPSKIEDEIKRLLN